MSWHTCEFPIQIHIFFFLILIWSQSKDSPLCQFVAIQISATFGFISTRMANLAEQTDWAEKKLKGEKKKDVEGKVTYGEFLIYY